MNTNAVESTEERTLAFPGIEGESNTSAKPIRLTVVMTHPVQYCAPWFRQIARDCGGLELTVLYATQPTPEQQGVGFGKAFTWDTSLTDGYQCRIVRPPNDGDSVHSDDFWGLDVAEISEAIHETRPDVVLITGWYSVTLVRALRACRRLKIPVLYRGDTNLRNAPTGWRRLAWQAKTRLLLRQFDAFLSVGQRVTEYLRYFRVPAEKIHHSPHCVDNDHFANLAQPFQSAMGRRTARQEFGFDDSDFVVLFAGKLEEKKRPLDAIRAVAAMDGKSKMLIVGSGPLEDECKREAEKLGVPCRWAGFLNQSELGKAYAVADCLALPSGTETWGLVVNEAMATGLPCIVSDQVGCGPDLIERDKTGRVFRCGDIVGLAAALASVRRQTLAGFDWRIHCKRKIAKYSLAVASGGLFNACKKASSLKGSRVPSLAERRSPTRVLALCGHMVKVAGMERMTFEVLRVLEEAGVPRHCVVNSWEHHRISTLVKAVGASQSIGRYSETLDRHARNPIALMRMSWDVAATSAGLLRDAFRFRPTHILAPEFMSIVRNAPALLVLKSLGIQVILHVHNAPDLSPFYRRLWSRLIDPLVHKFICVSDYVAAEVVDVGVTPSKVKRIYNTVPFRNEAADSTATRQRNRIIFVGQIIPPKGVHILIDALRLLVSAGHDVLLDVVGEMAEWEPPAYLGYQQSLVDRAELPELKGRVRFLGYREDIPELIAEAGIHCCPSLPEQREAFGLVNIEAKQAGVPSVVTPTGALSELIRHKQDGWVASGVSAEALAEGIAYYLADEDRRIRAGAAAKTSVQHFRQEEFARQWQDIMEINAAIQRTETERPLLSSRRPAPPLRTQRLLGLQAHISKVVIR